MYMIRRKYRIPKSEYSRYYKEQGSLPKACNIVLGCDYDESEITEE